VANPALARPPGFPKGNPEGTSSRRPTTSAATSPLTCYAHGAAVRQEAAESEAAVRGGRAQTHRGDVITVASLIQAEASGPGSPEDRRVNLQPAEPESPLPLQIRNDVLDALHSTAADVCSIAQTQVNSP